MTVTMMAKPSLSPSEPCLSSDPNTTGLKEACGVIGILVPKTQPLGYPIFHGMYALQHRGQESCGMAVFDCDQLRLHKEMGLVNQVFNPSILDSMTGQIGLGHTRYSTTGGSHLDNAQPVVVRTRLGAVILAHNGNLINTPELSRFLAERQTTGFGDSDSHLMGQLIRYYLQPVEGLPEDPLKEAVTKALRQCYGAYSLAIATGDTLIAARDPKGLRPLSLGRLPNGGVVVASETCALDIMGAEFVRDILPGEILFCQQDGSQSSVFLTENPESHFCFFELVYFARPDSRINGQSVYQYRLDLGRKLAEISPPVEADVVIPVPDSGNVAAVGYSQASGVPYQEGLIKNRYVGRTFIHPTQELREQSIKLKLNPLTDMIRGKRIIILDDSVVRGNTSRKLVKMLRDCGVREIHLRISSALVKHPCYYGIDMSEPDQLIANQMSVEEIREWLGVDSLVFLSVEDMQAVGQNHAYCMACFDGEYPAGIPNEISAPEATPIPYSI